MRRGYPSLHFRCVCLPSYVTIQKGLFWFFLSKVFKAWRQGVGLGSSDQHQGWELVKKAEFQTFLQTY